MDDKKKLGSEPLEAGRKWKGEPFPTTKTPDEAAAEVAAQVPYAKPNAVPIESYFNTKRISDPTAQAMMKAFTKVRTATVEDFDSIFSKF